MPITRLTRKLLGSLDLARHVLRRDRGEPIILMYHGVEADAVLAATGGAASKQVPESLFRKQVELLAAKRRVVPLADLIQHLSEGRDCRGMLAITFDDGYLNNATVAAPILKKLGLPATVFLATGFVGAQRWAWTDRLEHVVGNAPAQDVSVTIESGAGQPRGAPLSARLSDDASRAEFLRRFKAGLKTLGWREAEQQVAALGKQLGLDDSVPYGKYRFMTWDDARRMVADGFEMGAHTVNHVILSRVALGEAQDEILHSRQDVAREVGKCCRTFCYPNGISTDFTPAILDFCRGHFDAALSAMSGTASLQQRYEIRRIGVGAETTVKRLAARLLSGR